MESVSEHLETPSGVCGGMARMAGTRISVIAIAKMYLEMRESLEEIVKEYNLSLKFTHQKQCWMCGISVIKYSQPSLLIRVGLFNSNVQLQ